MKSNLPQQQIVKTLKTLESKKLIKSVKSVQQGLKKKVYMLADLAPDESVTGGAWYSDQDFESEFVEVLNQQCLKYLQHKVCVCVCVCSCFHSLYSEVSHWPCQLTSMLWNITVFKLGVKNNSLFINMKNFLFRNVCLDLCN